jgi:hypothetical protein
MIEDKRHNGITLEKARKILGKEFEGLSDKELQTIIEDLYFLAHFSFDNF